MPVHRAILMGVVFLALALISAGTGTLWADSISPAQEQEFADAKGAVAAARKEGAEQYATESLRKAEEYLQSAENAKKAKDETQFSRSSRLARAYADLAKAFSEYTDVSERLKATNEELRKAKAEIDSLKQPQ